MVPSMKNHTETDQDECPECVMTTPSDEEVSGFQHAIRTISGKWKIEIICALIEGPRRFGELRRALPAITQHMLTAQLRELEASGLVLRTAFPEIPPRVEYELTDAAYGLRPAFDALLAWSQRFGATLKPAAKGPGKAARRERVRAGEAAT